MTVQTLSDNRCWSDYEQLGPVVVVERWERRARSACRIVGQISEGEEEGAKWANWVNAVRLPRPK